MGGRCWCHQGGGASSLPHGSLPTPWSAASSWRARAERANLILGYDSAIGIVRRATAEGFLLRRKGLDQPSPAAPTPPMRPIWARPRPRTAVARIFAEGVRKGHPKQLFAITAPLRFNGRQADGRHDREVQSSGAPWDTVPVRHLADSTPHYSMLTWRTVTRRADGRPMGVAEAELRAEPGIRHQAPARGRHGYFEAVTRPSWRHLGHPELSRSTKIAVHGQSGGRAPRPQHLTRAKAVGGPHAGGSRPDVRAGRGSRSSLLK